MVRAETGVPEGSLADPAGPGAAGDGAARSGGGPGPGHRRSAEKMAIDLRDDVLTLTGEAETDGEASEEPIIMEYGVGKYYRQFTLGELINQENIDAKLNDGVLRLSLPKVEKATPKKITVKAG